jgi:MYXO-CTERM domain-containing protein
LGSTYVRASGTSGVSNLAPGFAISSTSTFGAGNAQTTGANAFVLSSANNIVGFRFTNEATSAVHYGWFRISLGTTLASVPRTVVEYAYENVAGASIAAGAIPAPGALAVLGLAGLAGRRRR